MQAVGLIDFLGKAFERSQKPERRPHHFEDRRLAAIVGRNDRGVARHTGEYRHLAKAGSGENRADLSFRARVVLDINFQFVVEREIESVAAPLALTHDHFAGRVGE